MDTSRDVLNFITRCLSRPNQSYQEELSKDLLVSLPNRVNCSSVDSGILALPHSQAEQRSRWSICMDRGQE